MTRTEFDNQCRELRAQKAAAVQEIAAIQYELKEEIIAKNRQIKELGFAVTKLKQQLQCIGQHREKIVKKWNAQIHEFVSEYCSTATSNLAEATTINIVYELRRRGFEGIISRQAKETSECESYDLQKKFEPNKLEEGEE